MTIEGIGAPDATIESAQDGFVLRDSRTGKSRSLGRDLQTGLPEWANAVAIRPGASHITWMYKRPSYAMALSVDKLGFVDAIAVAGEAPGAPSLRVQGVADAVKLGDGLGLLLKGFGYPKTIENYQGTAPEPTASSQIFELRYTSPESSESERETSLAVTVQSNRVVRFYAYTP